MLRHNKLRETKIGCLQKTPLFALRNLKTVCKSVENCEKIKYRAHAMFSRILNRRVPIFSLKNCCLFQSVLNGFLFDNANINRFFKPFLSKNKNKQILGSSGFVITCDQQVEKIKKNKNKFHYLCSEQRALYLSHKLSIF